MAEHKMLTIEEVDALINNRKWDAPELIDIVLQMARRAAAEIPTLQQGVVSAVEMLDTIEELAEDEYGNVNPWREYPPGEALHKAEELMKGNG